MTALRGALVVLAAALGASLASFLTLCAERWSRHEAPTGRSRCECGRPLEWWENVPVVGFVAARGRARCCGARLARRYLVYEAMGALLGAVAAWYLTSGG